MCDSIDRVGVRVGMTTSVGVVERVKFMPKYAVCLIIHMIHRTLSCFSAQSTTQFINSRKHKSVGRDIGKGCKFLINVYL